MREAKELILASSSPRRQAYLRELGLTFRVVPADIDETPQVNEDPIALAHRLASSKAQAVAQRLPQSTRAVIVAADTVVAMGRDLLGKPDDAADAIRMLRVMRDADHDVHSAVSVLEVVTGQNHTQQHTMVSTTVVRMRDYSDEEIAAYVATGDPLDKAGAYAIQHPAFRPAASIQGCLSGVVGLPLGVLRDLLGRVGIEIRQDVVAVCEAHTHFACCQRTHTGQR